MRRRAFAGLAIIAVMFAALAVPALGAPVQLRITKWELTTVHNHKRTVASKATIRFCANDPYTG